MIYLDNNATTLIDPRVATAMQALLGQMIGNPSSTHQVGQKARHLLIKAREQIASMLGCQSDELCFTSSATESLHLLLSPKVKPRHILTSALEHTSTLAALKRLGGAITFLEPERGQGAISLAAIEKAIQPETDLLVFMAANNETGIKSDLAGIADLAEKRAIPLIVDGVALFGKEPFVMPKGVSGFCLSSHKIHGPKGVALAMIRKSYKTAPLIVGGAQQFGRRAGTEDVLGIMAFAEAIKWAVTEAAVSEKHMRTLRDLFEEEVQRFCPDCVIHGKDQTRVANVSNISFPGEEAENLVIQLDLAGVCVSHGSACSSGGLEPSHVLMHMGLSSELVRSALRFSLSRFTTEEEIRKAVFLLKENLGLALMNKTQFTH